MKMEEQIYLLLLRLKALHQKIKNSFAHLCIDASLFHEYTDDQKYFRRQCISSVRSLANSEHPINELHEAGTA